VADCQITPRMILQELEGLAGIPKNSTRLHHNIGELDAWLLWQVNNRYIRVGPVPAEDLALSLDDFNARYCRPAVNTMREGMDV